MNFLVLDGNSIINRAFYGIKLLTTRDGRYTNAVYGFMNILFKLEEETKPDCVAVTFDLKAPTFRHKMYADYKAGRKPMPSELAEQMPVIKELLSALGYVIVTKEGYEADDIIGTLAYHTPEGDNCFIATGDRDSLQLVSENVKVLLAATKMGRPETTVYDIENVKEDYGVVPDRLRDIKALMGDASDNIPGVAGVGKKTAEELVSKFGTLDEIYESLENLEIRQSVKDKLLRDKDSAYLSFKLGTIDKNAPVDTSLASYRKKNPDTDRAFSILSSLEMYKIIEKLGLKPGAVMNNATPKTSEQAELKIIHNASLSEIGKLCSEDGELFFNAELEGDEIKRIVISRKAELYILDNAEDILSFADILNNAALKKYTHNSKPVYSWYLSKGREIEEINFDSMLAAYLLNPSAKEYTLSTLHAQLNVPVPETEEEELADYSGFDVICRKQAVELERLDEAKLFGEIEMPLAKVLSAMETVGVAVDRQGIEEFNEKITEEIAELEKDIYLLAGEEFNINSPKQLGETLFVKLAIPTKKKTKTGFSTNAEVLEGLADEYEIVRKVLQYRTYAKLKSTYCDGLLTKIAPDGRIHSSFNQTETRTGRISSTEPNLQNIPVRTELGREMRKFFVAKEGYTLVDADYSQIELRVLASIADDDNMINAFNSEVDIHTVTASQVFNVPQEAVTSLLRTRAKAVNFGIVYGIGAFSLSKDIGVTRKEADRYINDYLHHYSGVDRYMKEIVEKGRRDGYVSTLFGRRRYLPEITASNGMIRSFGERVARNMPIQGTAADIIKIAMIRVYNRLKAEKLDARLILQVHDELIVEAEESIAEQVRKIVSEEMENACKMKVRLVSDAHIGKTWYLAKG